ncbi:hypothetical protein FOJ82_00505 [Tessaracoccus rhinocerotis]|uniref:Uncharacterized protein n=1 Tax=Tessaracoccus rhinocerotis TaxID=1689449 RepID=A0A553K3Z9_9ACTN|nr:hypothetical protein [Tessaracoccus rhinocerotis]TRY19433.1 hypothetical protein FOJ82_00505 [Tessaracoccus rhinocerotis]
MAEFDEITFGDAVPSNNPETSKLEESVRDFLLSAGYGLSAERLGIVCHHPDRKGQALVLTPALCSRSTGWQSRWIPAIQWRGTAIATTGRRRRTASATNSSRLSGWTVITLRIGAEAGGEIGDRDVLVESSGFTKAAQSALVQAIEDFQHGWPAPVRFVPKGKSPSPAKRPSHVVNIGEFNYSHDGHFFTWVPSLDDSTRMKLRLCAGGRYLYTHDGRKSRFVAEVGLQDVSSQDWKAVLTEILASRDPEALDGEKWPWGPTLLVPGDPAHDLSAEFVKACERKGWMDDPAFAFTVSGDTVAEYSEAQLISHDGVVVAQLHRGAAEAGYRIAVGESRRGSFGPYEEYVISRVPR